MKTRIIHFITLCLLLLVTGTFWGTWFTLTRSIDNFSAAEFIHIGKVIIANVAVPMSIIMPSCIVFIAISLWLYTPKKSMGFYLAVLSLILLLVSLAVTLIVLVPIDNELKQRTASNLPSNWESIRARWDTFHTVRTFAVLAVFRCQF